MTSTLAPAPEITEAPPVVLEFPAYRLPELINKIDIANRRLAKTEITERFTVTTEAIDRKVLKGGIKLEDGTLFGATEVIEPYIRATLNDLKITAGHYTFVAALVGEEAGYTVHCAPGQNLDGWQRPAVDDITCDHCNLKRDRRRLYIVRDERDGRLAQIGHSCIELYTGLKLKGLWALEFGKQLRGFGSDSDGGGPRDYSAPVDRVLGLSFAFADEGRGYVSMNAAEFSDRNPTAGEVRIALFGRVDAPRAKDYRSHADYLRALEDYRRFLDNIQRGIAFSEDADLIAEIRAAADTLAPGTDYADNMRVILAGEYVSYRNVGVLASLVAVYSRKKELRVQREKAPAPAKGFLAPVKTRVRNISLVLTTVKTWEGQYGWTTLLVGRTPEGTIVKWFASGEKDYRAGDTLNLKAATVKAHEEYQGQDQTVITRGIIA